MADGIAVNNVIEMGGNLIFSAGSRVFGEIGEEGVKESRVKSILGYLKV